MTDTDQEKYLSAALEQSEVLTKRYSTSFSTSLLFVHKRIRPAMYALYGMVRIADEIVDTKWESIDTETELDAFETEVFKAIDVGYSSNPIIHAFQWTYTKYGMEREHVEAFFRSMRLDIGTRTYSEELYKEYIHGSAEVVGLMSLHVFYNGDAKRISELSSGAKALGSAFQKINFLRDIQEDYEKRGRIYFPDVSTLPLTDVQRTEIEKEIDSELVYAKAYIRALPQEARWGVYLAYLYYSVLFKKLKGSSPATLMRRQSVHPGTKILLFIFVYIRFVLRS